jgi:1,4-alpha-glucan branching enzyme
LVEKMTEKTRTMSKQTGMGAIPHAKGVTFWVWAPHAEKVYLIGTFNGWSKTSTPLAREENGYWSTDVSEAKTGDEYRYLIYAPTDWNLPQRYCLKVKQ